MDEAKRSAGVRVGGNVRVGVRVRTNIRLGLGLDKIRVSHRVSASLPPELGSKAHAD